MFVDIAKIRIKAGDGGNGAVSFRREKYVAAGGPDGGDGGRGGNIVFQADTNLSTLADFRYQRKYTAQNGENGRGSRCNGKSAPDLVIRVPLGTVVKDAETGGSSRIFPIMSLTWRRRAARAAGEISILPPPPVRCPGSRSREFPEKPWR